VDFEVICYLHFSSVSLNYCIKAFAKLTTVICPMALFINFRNLFRHSCFD